MTGKGVSLMEMLNARELCVHRQLSLQRKYTSVLICFTMNIVGSAKNNRLVYRAFECDCDILRYQLVNAGIERLHQECYCENTGNVRYYCVKGNAVEIKKITVEMENNLPVGHLFDTDAPDENGIHIGRMEIGGSPRTCLLCGNPAKECARSRTHPVAEFEQTTKELLLKEFQEQDSRRAVELAYRSLLYKVCTTSKLGLVGRRNNGSHKGMDYFTLTSSTASLWFYFQKCAQMGVETAQELPKEILRRLRWAGRITGYDMNQATNGINIHKGALLSTGILCGALGRLPREKQRNVEVVLGECAAMIKGIIEHDSREVTEENVGTIGEKLYVKYGITGIRGRAEKGFSIVMEAGLPALERGLKKGLSLEQAGCTALLVLMVSTVDTNLIVRSNRETQFQVTEEIKETLERNPYPEEDMLEILDRAFISKNLSPGGSVDLLTSTYFLHFLKRQQTMGFVISQIYPNDHRGIKQVKTLLEKEGIILDKNLDCICCSYGDSYNPAAAGGCFGNTLRCFVVSKSHQGEGLLNQVVSHLTQIQFERGNYHLFLYAECGSIRFFGDLGFYKVVRTDSRVVFTENRRTGFRDYLEKLEKLASESKKAAAIVTNANPLMLGHQYLVEKAAEENDIAYLFVISEDASLVPFAVRKKLAQEGVAHLPNAVVHESGPYIISNATFPSYFLKDEETVIEGYARLDLAVLFQIARELQTCRRHAGEESLSQVTGIYNRIMEEELKRKDIDCIVVPRKEKEGTIISASVARQYIKNMRWEDLRKIVLDTTWNYFTSAEAQKIVAAIQNSDNVIHY